MISHWRSIGFFILSLGLLGSMTDTSCSFKQGAALSVIAEAEQQAQYSLRQTLSQYPLEVGRFWTYDVVEVIRDFGDTSQGTGQTTIRIIGVVDGRVGRLAKAEEEFGKVAVTGNRPQIHYPEGTVLPWLFVAVPGRIYEAASLNEDLIARTIERGAKAWEEWGAEAPTLVFPLTTATRWSDKYVRYTVVELGAIGVPAGFFHECFKISFEKGSGAGFVWFCPGIGDVYSYYSEPEFWSSSSKPRLMTEKRVTKKLKAYGTR